MSNKAGQPQFIGFLRIEAELPKRDDLEAKLLLDVLPDIVTPLGWSADELPTRFDAIRAVVRIASSSDTRSESRRLAADTDLSAAARSRARKTVTRQKLEIALAEVAPRSPTRLVQKLDRAGFGPSDVERSKLLRADWLELENQWDPAFAGIDRSRHIRKLVRDAVIDAETATRRPGTEYGQEMRNEAESALRNLLPITGEALDTDHLLGAAFDETDRCRLWWSDRFDLDGVV